MSDNNSNSVRSFKKESVIFIINLQTLCYTMLELSITLQSRNYKSSAIYRNYVHFATPCMIYRLFTHCIV